MLLIVLFYKDYRVLTLSHLKVVTGSVHTESVGFKAPCYLFAWQGVGMYRDKEVCFRLVGYLSPFVKSHKFVRLPRIDDSHVRAVTLYVCPECEGCAEVYVFLFCFGSYSPCIMSAVSGINDEGKFFW